MLARLCDVKTQCRILCERSFLKTLGGGCSAPVAVCSVLKESVEDEVDFSLIIDGAVWSLNGQTEIVDKGSCSFKLEKIKVNLIKYLNLLGWHLFLYKKISKNRIFC